LPDERTSLQEHLVKRLSGELKLPHNGFPNVDEISHAARSPLMTIGGHTLTHANMALCSTSQLKSELTESRKKLCAWTGQEVEWFAYPFGGRGHFNAEVVSAVQRAGFRGALTTVPGYVNNKTNIYLVPRMTVQTGWGNSTFQSKVFGVNLHRIATSASKFRRSREMEMQNEYH
jgi:peptidoglycan/xylan/chitin deacetylase (PgdA/CDA1 family)